MYKKKEPASSKAVTRVVAKLQGQSILTKNFLTSELSTTLTSNLRDQNDVLWVETRLSRASTCGSGTAIKQSAQNTLRCAQWSAGGERRLVRRKIRTGQNMTTARAETKGEAIRLLEIEGVAMVELDYESAWQDASELSHLGVKTGVRVEYRGHESVAVESPAALAAGLKRPKLTFRQRNLYCQFALTELTACELAALEARAMKMGDYILAGHLLRDTDSVWAG